MFEIPNSLATYDRRQPRAEYIFECHHKYIFTYLPHWLFTLAKSASEP